MTDPLPSASPTDPEQAALDDAARIYERYLDLAELADFTRVHYASGVSTPTSLGRRDMRYPVCLVISQGSAHAVVE